jgi:sialic acid synthase SpsE
MSTGMANLSEIEEAVQTIRESGGAQLALLKCTSAYPAPFEEMNLRTIPHLADTFGIPSGLSDHTLGNIVPLAAVTLGACIIEKHLTLSRKEAGPDSNFSMEPREFKEMVGAVRNVEKALGKAQYEVTQNEKDSTLFRRSIFVVKDMQAGELFSEENIRSIRPGQGLHTRYFDEVLNLRASRALRKGTPLSWDCIRRE